MIIVNYDEITDLDTAIQIIRKLELGIHNCYTADFNICPKCKNIMVKGYICPVCGCDPSDIKISECKGEYNEKIR